MRAIRIFLLVVGGLAGRGFASRWIKKPIREADDPGWFAYLPAPSTLGDVACKIRYNETAVTAAEISER
jgi:hypothetical protein